MAGFDEINVLPRYIQMYISIISLHVAPMQDAAGPFFCDTDAPGTEVQALYRTRLTARA
jgi:hypothetical protein